MKTTQNNTALITIAAATLATACTGQLPNSFRLQNQQESFDAQLDVNTKIDLLWVVDNSSSMDVAQAKLRNGFSAFATKYMQPTWDIRAAVITTDTYLANSAFTSYLGTTISGTTGTHSNYIVSRLASWSNLTGSSLVNTGTGNFDSGVMFGDLVPLWGPNYARLKAGIHDGPITALCYENSPYFFYGATNCQVRDAAAANTGTSHCLNPSTGEDSESQCVNTTQNDSVRSGRAIIETLSPDGVNASAAYKQALIDDFMINVSTGSAGMGSERGLGSVQQLLTDNETSDTAFFRKGSTRVIIFVSDEEDQTMTIESTPPAGFTPWTHYHCDLAGLTSLNGSATANAYCCTGGSCPYGSEGTTCASKTVDGYTYTPSVCADTARLTAVSTVKSQIDSFFHTLDGTSSDASANYFVTAIVPLTGDAIQSLQASRSADDATVGVVKTISTDRGDRYIELATQVGNGSLTMNIADTDYTPILDQIGETLVAKQGTFALERAPTGSEEVQLRVKHSDDSLTTIDSSKYTIVDKSIVINDLDTILSFRSGDKIVINYQPNSLF